MWVQTTTGQMVNIAEARVVTMEASFDHGEREAMQIVARYGNGETIILALCLDDSRTLVDTQAKAMYKAVVESLRDGEHFCDLSE
jgi:hypothetical protein